MIAAWASPLRPDLVAAPTTGGIILSYEVARQLRTRAVFAESDGEGRSFQRGFALRTGERTLVVDDALTTGGSVRDVLGAVRRAGAEPVGVAVLIDRTGGRTDFGLPFFACLTLDLPSYEPRECPLCEKGVPLTVT